MDFEGLDDELEEELDALHHLQHLLGGVPLDRPLQLLRQLPVRVKD